MSTRGGRFTQQEVAYLQSTAAVDRATTSRITYSAAFKRESLRRYLNGESPVKLFREAGLPPELVGYKRIGRAFSRWKENKDAILSAEPEDDQPNSAYSSVDANARLVTELPQFDGALPNVPGEYSLRRFDVRDTLIVQQIRYFAQLENQIISLKAIIAAHDKGTGAAADDENA